MREPWDLLRGRDVFTQRTFLNSELSDSFFSHWAPNCASFSRARERPIPGVKFAPKPLRSTEHPRGIPEVLAKLPKAKRLKLELDTEMAEMAANDCISRSKRGRAFSLEHPRNSIARSLESWKTLESMPGTIVTEYHTCMFEGSKRRKHQVLIHNTPELQDAIARICHSNKKCSRTKSGHLSWKPKVEGGKVVCFSTGEEREYPIGFCRAFAMGLKEAAKNFPEDWSFLEIFSGPSAPLSSAVSLEFGEDPPVPMSSSEKWSKIEASGLAEMGGVKPSIQNPINPDVPQRPPVVDQGYRLEAVESAKQPSFGKRTQMIPDGLNCPKRHLELAKGLPHPFDGEVSLSERHKECLERLQGNLESLNKSRLRSLSDLRNLVKSRRSEQAKANTKAAWTTKALGCKIQTVAMEELQAHLGLEDRDVPKACLTGLKVLGPAQQSPFFTPFDVPPKLTWGEYQATKRQRSLDLIRRVKRMSELGGQEMAAAIWKKTQKEIDVGSMGPPMTWDEVDERFKADFQVVPSFGLEQGVDEAGQPKFRRIDDHTAAGNNLVAHRLQKVPMAMVVQVGLMLKSLAKRTKSRVLIATEDMKGAYRQVPLCPSDVRYCITAVMNPELGEPSLHELRAQPFGAGHAVPNFCRVAEWLARLCQKKYHLFLDHFFDDFFLVEPAETATIGMFVLKESFSALGFALDPEKSQPPAQVQAVLGVMFSTASLNERRVISVSPKPSRITGLQNLIQGALKHDALSPSQAASLVGKFGFLCSTLFGKAGRCCTGPARFRQYSSYPVMSLDPPLRQSLELMSEFLTFTPAREIPIQADLPLIIYSDASDVPERSPRFILGGVCYDPIDSSLEFSSWEVPNALVQKWAPKQNYMGQLELLAAPFASATWSERAKQRPILFFLDNDSASSNLIKGYSPKTDSSIIVGEFWLMAASLKSSIYIDRVESKSNLADGPSRHHYLELYALGGRWKEPDTGRLGSLTVRPARWFGTPATGGEDANLEP